MINIWTKKELARAIELRLQGLPWAQVAERINRSESALWVKLSKLGVKLRADGRDEEAVRENLIKLHHELLEASATEEDPRAAQATTTPQELPVVPAKTLADTSVEEDIEESRVRVLLAEARESKRKYQEVLDQRALEDRLVDIFRERVQTFLPTVKPPPPLPPTSKVGQRSEAAVLLISDTHVGQVVSSSQTNGFGFYNPRIYCERLRYVELKVLEIIGQAAAGIDELHIFLLGDILHGGLNHGAEREDNALIADQFQIAIWTLFQFICGLALRVPSVHVHTVVGNHGRFPGQHKMPSKNRYSNLDHMVYGTLQLTLQAHGLTNVTMNLNTAPRQVVDIKGSRFLAAHGDHLRGGDKQFGVPLYSMTRDVNATFQRFAAAEDRPVDYFLCGDKHKGMSLPLARGEYLINGALVGADEFAMSFAPGEPMQLLFGVDPKLRKTWSYAVKVMHAPSLPACPYDLPDQVRYLVEDESNNQQED